LEKKVPVRLISMYRHKKALNTSAYLRYIAQLNMRATPSQTTTQELLDNTWDRIDRWING